MSELLTAINDFYHQNGQYPKVKVTMIFALENHHMLEKIVDMLEIDETVDQWELE